MKLAIMQPYFLPYIGYFQLLSAVDLFIVYDNIKYTKKGWINRNRFLQNGTDSLFSLPLKKDSDFLDVRERALAADFNPGKLLNQFHAAYLRAPFFAETFTLLQDIVHFPETNLFGYIHNSLVKICRHLGITTEIAVSSTIEIEYPLKNQEKVIALCRAVGATDYVNAIGGLELYAPDVFSSQGIALHFIKSRPVTYRQFHKEFVPWLSIVDVLMFNSVATIREWLASGYELLPGQCHG